MSISKKEFYSEFLYGFSGNLVKWELTLYEDNSNSGENNFKDLITGKKTSATKENDEKEDTVEEEKPKKLELEVLFGYNKKTGYIRLTGVQITSVLGFPSSSIIFNSKDIKNMEKINSSYEFFVKSSPYRWRMTLSNSM